MRNETALTLAGALVTGVTPLVFPQIPFGTGLVIYSIAGGLLLYGVRERLRWLVPKRWRAKPVEAAPNPHELPDGAPRSESPTWLDEVERRGGRRPDATFLDDLLAGETIRRAGPGEPQGIPWPITTQPPKFDMTLNQLVRRVAFESNWAADFNPDTPGTQWQETFWWQPLKKEIFRGLVGGEVKARGVLNRRGEEPDTGPTDIPIDFWRKADFAPELMLTEATINSAGNGVRGEIYTDIEVRSRDVNVLWPFRTEKAMEEKPSPFVAWHKQWWEEQEDARLNDALLNASKAQMVERAQRAERAKLSAVADLWRETDPLQLYQAACLWVGESPPADVEGQLPAVAIPVLDRLKKGMREGNLPYFDDPEGLKTRLLQLQSSMSPFRTEPVEISNSAQVDREGLRAFAETIGERPAFLFGFGDEK